MDCDIEKGRKRQRSRSLDYGMCSLPMDDFFELTSYDESETVMTTRESDLFKQIEPRDDELGSPNQK